MDLLNQKLNVKINNSEQIYDIVKRLNSINSQGDIYLIKACNSDEVKCLKIPKDQSKENIEHINNLTNYRELGKYTFPQTVVEVDSLKGYVMEFLPESTYRVSSICANGYLEKDSSGKIVNKAVPYFIKLKACYNISKAVEVAHHYGLIIADLKPENIFLNPKTGQIKIIDTDGICEIKEDKSFIIGTRGYADPLIMRHKAKISQKSDVFSMAVVIFSILFGVHPFVGRRIDEEGELSTTKSLFVTNPLYIFNNKDNSNALYETQQFPLMIKDTMPAYLLDAFDNIFVKNLFNIDKRETASWWSFLLKRLCADAQICPRCNAVSFGKYDKCMYCGSSLLTQEVRKLKGDFSKIIRYGETIFSKDLFVDHGVRALFKVETTQNTTYAHLRFLGAEAEVIYKKNKFKITKDTIIPIIKDLQIKYFGQTITIK